MNKPGYKPFFVFLLFISSACTSYRVLDGNKKTISLSDITLKQNTRLSGHIRISGILEVPKGIILRIDPDTQIEFVFTDINQDGIGDSGMVVEGTILAEGTTLKPILFSGNRNGPKSWSEIRLEHNQGSRFVFCSFQDAHWGLHIHYSHTNITNCRFIDNYGGLRFRSGPVTIQESFFSKNSISLRYIASNPIIRGNTFEKNLTAIFIREGSTNPVITNNSFYDGLAVVLGESQQEDIPAPDNFWGSDKIIDVENVILDKHDLEYLGRVLYSPIALKPFPTETSR